jgi:hypothetical protein
MGDFQLLSELKVHSKTSATSGKSELSSGPVPWKSFVAVKAIPAREAAMTGNRPSVVAIEIRPISPSKGGL